MPSTGTGASRVRDAASRMTKPRHGAASSTAPFTPVQGQYLAFMHTYEGIHGCAPAEADLQRHFGVTPPSVH